MPRLNEALGGVLHALGGLDGRLAEGRDAARVEDDAELGARTQLPDRPEVNDTLGWIYHKKGLSALAVSPLLQSIQKDPTNATYHYHLGMAYAGSGDKDKARDSLQKALSMNPKFDGADEARKTLADLSK